MMQNIKPIRVVQWQAQARLTAPFTLIWHCPLLYGSIYREILKFIYIVRFAVINIEEKHEDWYRAVIHQSMCYIYSPR